MCIQEHHIFVQILNILSSNEHPFLLHHFECQKHYFLTILGGPSKCGAFLFVTNYNWLVSNNIAFLPKFECIWSYKHWFPLHHFECQSMICAHDSMGSNSLCCTSLSTICNWCSPKCIGLCLISNVQWMYYQLGFHFLFPKPHLFPDILWHIPWHVLWLVFNHMHHISSKIQTCFNPINTKHN